jgi:preprotein translocase subunit SecD
MKRQKFWLTITVLVTATSLLMALPRIQVGIDQKVGPIDLKIDSIGGYDIDFDVLGIRFNRPLRFQPGLDLQGGIQAILEADMEGIEQDRRNEAIDAARGVIERRINFLGVSEPNIYTSVNDDIYRIVVELPGVTDTDRVIELIGQTAQLDFREETDFSEPLTIDEPTTESDTDDDPSTPNVTVPEPYTRTELTGKYLKRASVGFDPNTNAPLIQITFDDEGAKLFEDLTSRNVGKTIANYLDDDIVTAPTVSQAISGGDATITGEFTIEEAKDLALQLNAGALPVPVEIIQQKTIGPTLGEETVNKSVIAGLVGLLMVAVFMIVNYRLFGVFAVFGLTIYGLITIALYKYVPVTLTLSGIAGFILSVGMAVDANILIFERIREEIRLGKTTEHAIRVGFARAWDSIRDANTATLITVFILFNPLNWSFLVTSGTVRGFALTLGLGVLISLFTGVVVTRVLIYSFYPMGGKGKS